MASRSNQQAPQATTKSSFFQQRDALVGDIAISLENVLQNMNKLNRSLEGVIAVGNEFGAVEALWSQFEGVMAQEPVDAAGKEGTEKNGSEEGNSEEEGGEDMESGAEKRRGR